MSQTHLIFSVEWPATTLFASTNAAYQIRLKSSVNQDRIGRGHFTDKNLGNVSSRKLQRIASVSGHPWAPTGKMEFPLCFVKAFNLTSACIHRGEEKKAALWCASSKNVHFTSYFNLSPTSKTLFKTKRGNAPSDSCRCHFMCF